MSTEKVAKLLQDLRYTVEDTGTHYVILEADDGLCLQTQCDTVLRILLDCVPIGQIPDFSVCGYYSAKYRVATIEIDNIDDKDLEWPA